jgi:hypothetical protein
MMWATVEIRNIAVVTSATESLTNLRQQGAGLRYRVHLLAVGSSQRGPRRVCDAIQSSTRSQKFRRDVLPLFSGRKVL